MVASNDSNVPRVAIIGITGKQGGSVADALIASSKPYRLVGLTRSAHQTVVEGMGEAEGSK